MEEKYLLVGGTIDETEDELDCWSEEYESLETARRAMEASVPVRDTCCEISPWYFVRIDQWDDEIDGWQPSQPARERVWTVLGFGSMRPDKWFSDGFEVAGPGRERVLCPDFDLLAEAIAHVEGSGTYRTRQAVPEGYAAWRAHGGWVGVRPLWGEGPHARNLNGKRLGRRGKLAGALEAPWAACREEMPVREGAAELAALGLFVRSINSLLDSRCAAKGTAMRKVGRGLYRYMP